MKKRDIVKDRIELLKAMNTYVIYHMGEGRWMTWITLGVPDCANEYDYEDIAEDDELYNEIAELFGRLCLNKKR